MSKQDNERVIAVADRIQSNLMDGFQKSLEQESERHTAQADYVEALIRTFSFHLTVAMGDWINDEEIVSIVEQRLLDNLRRTIEGWKEMHLSEEE